MTNAQKNQTNANISPQGWEKSSDPKICEKFKIFFFSPSGGAWELKLHHLTQNWKLHQTVVTVCSWKKSPLTITFHSTITRNLLLDHKYDSADEKLNLFRLTRYKNLLPQISNRINFITLHAVILKQFWVKSSIVMKVVKDLTKSSSIFGSVLLETKRGFWSYI